MAEDWRPVVGYEGRYEVSSAGRVRSLDRVVQVTGQPSRQIRGKILKPFVNDGYCYVTLYLGDGSGLETRVRVAVHRLMLEAFVGPPPAKHETCHRNDVRNDNRLENLRWGTKSENGKDAYQNGRLDPATLFPQQGRRMTLVS